MGDNVFLVNFRNRSEIYPPFGIMYVADALEQAGFATELVHDTADGVDALVDRVAAERPLFVGFSTITGPQLRPTIEASKRVHALGVPVVWGGVHASIMPAEILREGYVDHVVVGEGEETVQELARTLAAHPTSDPSPRDEPIPGLASKRADGSTTVAGARPFIEDLDRFRPRWEKLDVERYLIPSGPYRRAIPVYISRGCPFRCGFCYNEVVMKRTWRQHGDAFILEQIQMLRDQHGIDAVDYADDYLFGRPTPMKRLVETVGMPWSGQVRVQLLSKEFVAWMRQTRCQWVNIGAESVSQRMLDLMTKDQKDWQVPWGIRNLVEGAPHIEANVSFIFGLPHERPEDARANLDGIEYLCSLGKSVRCSVSMYMPYPGTPLWQRALEAGYEPPSTQSGWAELDLDRSNTPWMDDAEARAMSSINDVLFVGRSEGHWVLWPYYALLRRRWRTGNFRHYWEGWIKERLLKSPARPLLQWAIDHLVRFNAVTHKGPTSEVG